MFIRPQSLDHIASVTDPQLISEGSQKLASVPSGGGGGGSAPAAAAGGAAPEAEKAEEKKEEAKEESDDDMVGLLSSAFGDHETDNVGLRSLRLSVSWWKRRLNRRYWTCRDTMHHLLFYWVVSWSSESVLDHAHMVDTE